jgi:hypothetical protein
MSHRPSARVSPEPTGRNTSGAGARAHLLDVELERPKRIDRYIDYFGGGKSDGVCQGAPRHSRAPSVGWTKVQ